MNYSSFNPGTPAKVSETVLTSFVCLSARNVHMLCAPSEGFGEGLRSMKYLRSLMCLSEVLVIVCLGTFLCDLKFT